MGSGSIARMVAGAALAAAVVALLWVLLDGRAAPDLGTNSAAPGAEHARAEPGDGEGRGATSDLSRRALVEQVILAGFRGDRPEPETLKPLADHDYGGLLIGRANWDGADRGAELIAALEEQGGDHGGIEPLIAAAQEGGSYRALTDLPPDERQLEIGERGSPEDAERWAATTAEALRETGVDLQLGLIADVATLDSAIADRAFSDDPAVAARMTAAAIRGCEEAEIACAPAHFPGLGAAPTDTAEGPASVSLDEAALRARDLRPFEAAFAAGAPAVVVSSGLYTVYDPVTPAALVPAITRGLLRDDLGFRGLAISDDLGSGAIRALSSPPAAAVRAIGAGIDMVQVADPREVEPVRRALLRAVADGTLGVQRLRDAAGRVLELKRELDRR